MESQLTKRGSGRELAIVLHGPHGSPEKMSDPRISTSLPLFSGASRYDREPASQGLARRGCFYFFFGLAASSAII
jgi:hypothetical protein